MDNRDNYWVRRLASRGVSRRGFIGGVTATGVGAVALGLVGCGDDSTAKPTASSGGSTTTTGGTTPAVGASPTAAAPQVTKGGISRILTNLPEQIPVLSGEIALLQTYWGAILGLIAANDNDPE